MGVISSHLVTNTISEDEIPKLGLEPEDEDSDVSLLREMGMSFKMMIHVCPCFLKDLKKTSSYQKQHRRNKLLKNFK